MRSRCRDVSDERCEFSLAQRLDFEQFARRLFQQIPSLREEPDGSRESCIYDAANFLVDSFGGGLGAKSRDA